MIAGPSEILIIADESADAKLLASDLLISGGTRRASGEHTSNNKRRFGKEGSEGTR